DDYGDIAPRFETFFSPGNNRHCERSEPRRTPGQGAWCETLWIASSALPPRNDDGFRHCEPKAKQSRSWSSHTRSSYKSRQAGLVDSINASFFLREAPLICFSRRMAFSMLWCASYHTRSLHP